MPRAPKRCQKCNLLIPGECACPQGWNSNKSPKLSGEWRKLRNVIRQRSGMRCQRCGVYDPNGEVDHILNRARGGLNHLSNLQFLCYPCHTAKTAEERRAGRRKRT